MAGALQRVDHFGWHVVFVMLGEHARRAKRPALELALGHDTLAFAEKIGHIAFIDDWHSGVAVGDAEIERSAIGFALDAASFDESPRRMLRPSGTFLV